jgi:hypothetical protein
MRTKFWLKDLKGRDQSENLGVDLRISIKIDLEEIGWDGVEWMHLAEDSDQQQALKNAVMNVRVPLQDLLTS